MGWYRPLNEHSGFAANHEKRCKQNSAQRLGSAAMCSQTSTVGAPEQQTNWPTERAPARLGFSRYSQGIEGVHVQ